MKRFLRALFGVVLVTPAAGVLPGQDTTALAKPAPEIQPLAGDVLVWRVQSKKAERLAAASKVASEDRVGTAGGNPGRIGIDGGCIITLRGVTATESDGLSIDRAGTTLTVRLHHGRIVVETFSVDVALETPQGRVEAKTAYFLAEVSRDATRVVAIDGELKVSNDLGKIDLGGGETAVLRKGTELAKGAPADPDKEVAGVAAFEEPYNVIKNPGFELDLKDWFPLRYANKPLAVVDDKTAHGGKKSVRIQIPNIALSADVVPVDANGEGQTAFYTLLDPKTIKTGTRYLLRFWVRTEDFAVDGKPVPLTFLSRGLVLPEGKGGFFSRLTCPPAQKKWTCARFVLEADQGNNRFGMNFPDLERGAFSGTVWLDDFFLAPIPRKASK